MTQTNTAHWNKCRIGKPVLINAAASLIAIAIAAYHVNKSVAFVAALAFAASIIIAAVIDPAAIDKATVDDAPGNRLDAQFDGLRQSTCLTALTCAWSAAALFLAYPIAGLNWLHGWEYGLAYALIAVGFATYANKFAGYSGANLKSSAIARAEPLAATLAVAIVVALIWMVVARKFATSKGDWLANDIFVASGCAILAASAFFVARLRRSRRKN